MFLFLNKNATFHICHGERFIPFPSPASRRSRYISVPREEVAGEAQDVVRLVLQDLTRRRRGPKVVRF